VNAAAEAVWQAVEPLLPGFTVEVVPEISSTNSELMRRVRCGAGDPVLLVAERQTAGRGRLGRAWHSEAGDSLTFSLGLQLSPVSWSGLSLAVGVSVAEALGPQVRIKWPNDLWVEDRKLAGILIETASFGAQAQRYAVIGVGINVRRPGGGTFSTPPASVDELTPGVSAADVLRRVALPLVQGVQQFEQASFASFGQRFAARDALRDRAVRLSDGTAGTAHGTDEHGGLLVHTAAGMTTVTSAEVSVRPA
jgi:BirA family biotin operon repressor/biotin-[acetyl-CoA-carboxylase] ligase